MRLYLDDDMDANELIGLLEHEGHEVVSPRSVAMRGAEDEAHLRYAAAEQYVLLTANVESREILGVRPQSVSPRP